MSFFPPRQRPSAVACLALALSACAPTLVDDPVDAARVGADAFRSDAPVSGELDAGSLTTDAPATAADAVEPGAMCPPAGPFGQVVGATAQDLVLTDCDGEEHRLHDLCERDAVWLWEFAAWCPPCRAFAMSEANRVYDRFRSEAGDRFEGWVVVSENASFDPASRMDCEEIRTRYGLHAPVLFDTEGRLQAAFGVPANEVHVVLGPGAEILFVDRYASGDVEAEIERALP